MYSFRNCLLVMVWLMIGSILWVTGQSWADEGMWTLENPPLKQLQQKYNFIPTAEWLEHVQQASVRFMDGGSGAFISPRGLVMTNHHVAVGQLQKMSSREKDYVATGFLAATPADEIKCADLEINVLMSMENVTARVLAVVKKGMPEKDALQARKAVMAEIEKTHQEQTGMRAEVVSLYHGGEYWLYSYKKYTDIRLVMAPERQVAYFGGDFDNFTFPRHDLDMAFFRIYENDQPIASPQFFKWNRQGAAKDELVFVPGHPGSTDRLFTYAQLENLRDFQYPRTFKMIENRLRLLREYSQRGGEEQRRALIQIFGLENGKKASTGEYQGLLEPRSMARFQAAENDFRKIVMANSEWRKKYGDCWDQIQEVLKKSQEKANQRAYRSLRSSRLASQASNIVRYVTEVTKPDAERLDGYHDADLETVRFRLFSPAPIYPDMEEFMLAGTLEIALKELGPKDEFLSVVLNGRTPAVAAKELISGTKLKDITVRKALIEGGEKAVQASTDPLIVLARQLDPINRVSEKWSRENVESVITSANEKLAQARFEVYGKTTYPDATFTLRLSYGTVKGYPMNGTKAPHVTTLYGLYDRALSFPGEADFTLPARFWERKNQLDLSTPVNFVSTCDIIGGNSGSPVINQQAELVGLIFDGNIESLPGRFWYDETANRAVSVHSAYIIEALRKLYDAASLADEIEGQ